MKNEMSNAVRETRAQSRTEAYEAEHGETIEAFLDRNGYTCREVRGIARIAVLLWETQAALRR